MRQSRLWIAGRHCEERRERDKALHATSWHEETRAGHSLPLYVVAGRGGRVFGSKMKAFKEKTPREPLIVLVVLRQYFVGWRQHV